MNGEVDDRLVECSPVDARITLVLFRSRQNRYSFNALVGALEAAPIHERLELHLPQTEEDLTSLLSALTKKRIRPVVGISFATPQLWDIQSLVNRLRVQFGNSLFLISGGPHPTADPQGTLELGFDICVRGEGEETLKHVLETLCWGRSLSSVKGISFMRSEKCISTGPRAPVNLDSYPPFGIKHGAFGPIEITRGCPFACAFSQTSHIFGTTPRHRTIDTVLTYVDVMQQRGLRDVRFISPNAFSYGSQDGRSSDLDMLEGLLRGIRDTVGHQGRVFFGSFPSEVRPEHVSDEAVRLVHELADNDNIIIGAQSGSQRVLELCNRGHRVEHVFNAVSIVLKNGLTPNVDFIFGLPGETSTDVQNTIAVMEELVRMGARIHAHTFMPLPQTRFATAPPGRVPRRIVSFLGRLTSEGGSYGDWRGQEELASRIARYLQTGQLGEA